jgi:hypothetical protein
MNALAIEVINNARAMREHMAWFVNSSGMKGAPEGVIKVLDDIAEGENMDERVKKDFMSNDEARKVRVCPLLFLAHVNPQYRPRRCS